jgi:hypothetical protein
VLVWILGTVSALETNAITPPASPTAASDIYAPVSGSIHEINEELGDQPALLNRSPDIQAGYAGSSSPTQMSSKN